MSSARKHLRNLAFNWGGHASTLLVMFFLSPYIVGKLDAVSYGIWSLLSVLTGYMGIFDLGVRASVGRHVALYLGKDDPVGVDETIRAGFGFFSLVGGLILLVGIGLGWLFPAIFDGVSPEYYDTVRVLLPLMVINVWLSAIAAIYSSVMAAHDRFDIARVVDMVVLLVRTVGTVYVLEMGWGLWGLVFAVIAGNVCAVIGNRFFSGRVHAGLRSFPFLYSKGRLRELFGYGVPAFITSVAVKIINQTDLVIVGIILTVSSVREYSVGSMLVFYSSTFIGLICQTFFPTIQRTVSGGTMGEVRSLLRTQFQISMSIGLLLYIGMVFYSKSFIYLWMFQENFDQYAVIGSSSVMMILALSKLPGLYIQPCQSVLAAMGFIRLNATLAIIEALFNVVFSLFFVLTMGWGISGVAAGTLVARLIVPAIWIPFIFCLKTSFSIRQFFMVVLLPGVFSSLFLSLFCTLIIHFYPPNTWGIFVVNIMFSVFIWGVIASVLLIPRDMRHRLINFAKKKFTRPPNGFQ